MITLRSTRWRLRPSTIVDVTNLVMSTKCGFWTLGAEHTMARFPALGSSVATVTRLRLQLRELSSAVGRGIQPGYSAAPANHKSSQSTHGIYSALMIHSRREFVRSVTALGLLGSGRLLRSELLPRRALKISTRSAASLRLIRISGRWQKIPMWPASGRIGKAAFVSNGRSSTRRPARSSSSITTGTAAPD